MPAVNGVLGGSTEQELKELNDYLATRAYLKGLAGKTNGTESFTLQFGLQVSPIPGGRLCVQDNQVISWTELPTCGSLVQAYPELPGGRVLEVSLHLTEWCLSLTFTYLLFYS